MSNGNGSNVMPIRAEAMPQGAPPSPDQQWWGWGGGGGPWWPHPAHPIWPPPDACGGFGPPPGACGGFGPQQMFVRCICTPATPPVVPLKGPIIGITDGSDAQPGQVGEFVTATASMPYAAYPAVTQSVVSVMVLQPGDWDVYAAGGFSSLIGGANFFLNPLPTGFSNSMWGGQGFGGGTGTSVSESLIIISQTARALLAVPTVLAFEYTVSQAAVASLPAGTATITVEARRMR